MNRPCIFCRMITERLYLQKFESMEHFKTELIDYLDYYNNRRSKAKLLGLPPSLHNKPVWRRNDICLTFWGRFKPIGSFATLPSAAIHTISMADRIKRSKEHADRVVERVGSL